MIVKLLSKLTVTIILSIIFTSGTWMLYPDAHAVSLYDAVKEALSNSKKLQASNLNLRKTKNNFTAANISWIPDVSFNLNYNFWQTNNKSSVNDLLLSRAKNFVSWSYDNLPTFINSFTKSDNQDNILQILSKTKPLFDGINKISQSFVLMLQNNYVNLFNDVDQAALWNLNTDNITLDNHCLYSSFLLCYIDMNDVRQIVKSIFHQNSLKNLLITTDNLISSFEDKSLDQHLNSLYNSIDNLISLNTPQEINSVVSDLRVILSSIDNYIDQTLLVNRSPVLQNNVNISWNLFRGGQDMIDIQHKHILYDKSKVELDKTMHEVIYEAIDAYVSLYFVRQELDSVTQHLVLTQKWFKNIREQFESDMISTFDFTEARLMLMKAQNVVHNLHLQLASAEANYMNIIGKIHGDLEKPKVPIIPQIITKDFINQINQKNHNIQLSLYDLNLSRNKAYASLAKLSPSVDLVGKYHANVLSRNLAKVNDSVGFVLKVKFNILNAGRDVNDIYNNYLERQKSYLTLKQTHQDVHLEIMNNAFEIKKLQFELDFQKLNLEQANRKFKKVVLQIQNEVLSVEDLTQAFDGLLDTKKKLITTERLLILKSYKLLQEADILLLENLI